MNRKRHVLSALARADAQRETRRKLWRLVDALEVQLRIAPRDHRLVVPMGNGTERNNHEALGTWVREELERMQQEPDLKLLNELSRRLETVLTTWLVDRGT